MAEYSAQKSRHEKIAQQQSVESVSAISKMLSQMGFNLQLLGSERYVREKLESLHSQQMSSLKEAFAKNNHPRFKKEFAVSRHQPFGKTSDYTIAIRNANREKIALIKIVGMLNQTKVYLFCHSDLILPML